MMRSEGAEREILSANQIIPCGWLAGGQVSGNQCYLLLASNALFVTKAALGTITRPGQRRQECQPKEEHFCSL